MQINPSLKNDLDDGFIKDKEVIDPIFEIRDRSPHKIVHKSSYDEFFPSNESSEEIYTDNNFWKMKIMSEEEDFLKDL